MKRIWCGCLGFLCALLCTACDAVSVDTSNEDAPAKTDTAYPVVVGDVTLTAQPKRVVALSPLLADIVRDNGYGAVLCGVSDTCDTAGLDNVTALGDVYSLSYERLEVLTPDIIITQALPDTLQTWAAKQHVPVVRLSAPTNLTELQSIYETVGCLLGGNIEGKAVGTSAFKNIDTALRALAASVSVADAKQTVVYLADGGNAVATGDTLWQVVFDTVGLTNVARAGVDWTSPADMDTPDVVICPAALADRAKAKWRKATVMVEERDVSLRGGTVLQDVCVTIAHTLYPTVFPTTQTTTTTE